MKKKTILFFALVLSLSATAQMRILSNGHIVAGVDPKFQSPLIMGGGLLNTASPQSTVVSVDNTLQPDTTCAMTIGSTSYWHTGGYLAFGRGGAVRIGELAGQTDNILHLHSANSLRYTSPGGTIFNYTHSSTTQNSFTFSVPVSATKYLTTSDRRLKSDVRNLEGMGERLFDLTPVSYRLATGPQTLGTEEEKLSEQVMTAATENLTVPEYGFIAQEVKEIFPDLVMEREDGVLMVDYQGMIPLLVDAVSTLRQQVKSQQETIDRLTGDGVVKRQNAPAMAGAASLTENTLGQNRPNPTTGATVIDLSVDTGVSQAFVAFYDLTGQQLRRYDIIDRGRSQLTIADGEFAPGVYLYILVADGQEIQSRRMIVSD